MDQQTQSPKLKTGVLTSEFYITIVTSLIGLGVLLGYISPEQGKDLQENAKVLVDAVEMGMGAILAIIPVIAYILSRSQLKGEQLKAGSITNQLPKNTDAFNNTPSDPNLNQASAGYIVR